MQKILRNLQKTIVFLYVVNELSENEIKKTVTFIMALQRTKYLGIYLAKDVSGSYAANQKTLLKKIKEDLNKVRCLWVGIQYC